MQELGGTFYIWESQQNQVWSLSRAALSHMYVRKNSMTWMFFFFFTTSSHSKFTTSNKLHLLKAGPHFFTYTVLYSLKIPLHV